jgi:hypothetical protein
VRGADVLVLSNDGGFELFFFAYLRVPEVHSVCETAHE